MDIRVLGSGSNGNCYYVDAVGGTLLLDAGLSFKKIQRGTDFKLADLSGALITHSHADHSKSVKNLLHAGVRCYMAKMTANEIGVASDYFTEVIRPYKWIDVGSFRVKAFELEHDVMNYGYIIDTLDDERLVYITDTFYVKYRIPRMTHLMIEANYSYEILERVAHKDESVFRRMRRLLQSHMSLDTVVQFLQANDLSRLKHIYLIHMSDTNGDERLFKRRIMEVTGIPVTIA